MGSSIGSFEFQGDRPQFESTCRSNCRTFSFGLQDVCQGWTGDHSFGWACFGEIQQDVDAGLLRRDHGAQEDFVHSCWTALERCLEEDLAEAKKMEESAADFVEDIFGPIYSCTPKKESGDSASVGCLTEDLEEQTNRLNRIRLGLFLGKINVGNAEALESETHPGAILG